MRLHPYKELFAPLEEPVVFKVANDGHRQKYLAIESVSGHDPQRDGRHSRSVNLEILSYERPIPSLFCNNEDNIEGVAHHPVNSDLNMFGPFVRTRVFAPVRLGEAIINSIRRDKANCAGPCVLVSNGEGVFAFGDRAAPLEREAWSPEEVEKHVFIALLRRVVADKYLQSGIALAFKDGNIFEFRWASLAAEISLVCPSLNPDGNGQSAFGSHSGVAHNVGQLD